MKNIAIIVYDLINDYSISVMEGIASFFDDKTDYRLIFAGVNAPHSTNSDYDYQYWNSVKLLESQQIDGVILIPTSFTNYINYENLAKELEAFTERPVVSISTPVNLQNNKYTYNTSDLAYEQVVNHLIEKHKCKNIAYFTAGLTNSTESEQRFEAFVNAMEINNLEVKEDLIFQGDFTTGTAKKILAETISSKSDVHFDAILCANDLTAVGTISYLTSIGVKVPDEVKVIGFDDSSLASITSPTLSSISQTISLNGYSAAEMIYVLLEGEEIPDSLEIASYPAYRQSCGCIDCNNHTSSFIDNNGKYYDMEEKTRIKNFNAVQSFDASYHEIYNLISVMDAKITMDNIIEVLHPSMQISNISALMVCFYDEPYILNSTQVYKIPKTARVQVSVNLDSGYLTTYPLNEGLEINLSQRITPEEYDVLGGGKYFLHPIFFHNKNYGYILYKSNSKGFQMEAINLKLLSTIVLHAYEYSLEVKENELLMNNNGNLILQARTDELTKVFNRRGIYEYGQQMIDLNCSMNKRGLVFFCDLDGLKKINDTWGHKIGDLAIKTEAEVLKATFRESDFVGRLSGDEFCVVAPGLTLDKVDSVRQNLIEKNKIFSEKAGLPFVLSISIGGIEFTPEKNNIQELLQQADQHLYEEKHIKHSQK